MWSPAKIFICFKMILCSSGKEFEEATGLYYYGARWLDPGLAVWLTPDAYGEYFDPYGTSRNPVSIVDPDGNCELICITVIGAVAIGAYLGGSAANSTFNSVDWDYKSSDTYLGMGAGALIGAASGGLVAGGALVGGGMLGGALIGAGIGGGIGLGLESYEQVESGEFGVGGLFASAGIGAGFGAMTGAFAVGGLADAGFLSTSLFSSNVTYGTIMAGTTGSGALVGGIWGANHGNVGSGLLTGGAVGFGVGASIVGGHWGYQHLGVPAGKWLAGNASYAGITWKQMASLAGKAPWIGAGLGAAPGLATAYFGLRGMSNVRGDYLKAKAAYEMANQKQRDAKKYCVPNIAKRDPESGEYVPGAGETFNPFSPRVSKDEYGRLVFADKSCADFVRENY